MAKKVHEALTVANVAAWHYWWCRILGTDNEALFGPNDAPSKRLWALGNWSRFVRPGFVRMTTQGGPSGVYITAFRNPTTGAFAIVAVNDSGSSKTLGISLDGATPSNVVPWRTSSSEDLAQLTTITPSGGRFSVTLAANSVTTFVASAN
jgi:glucuronoarabinoxylan endo-1,4-beta-xylanase